MGPGVKGRLGDTLYYTTPKIEPFISIKNESSRMPISEMRFCDTVTLEKQESFFALLRGDILKRHFDSSVISTLLGLDLISKECSEKYRLTLKGRYYVSNIAAFLFGDCIETRKNKNDWFKRQERAEQ